MVFDDRTIVDVGGTIATAYCAKLFADYGACVVNLEPAAGFETRRLEPFVADAAPGEASAMHAYLHAKKRSVDSTGLSADARADLLQSAALVLDAGQTWLDDYDLRLRCRVTWYGQSGPYAGFHGSDAQCFALNSMLRIIGREEGPPLIPGGYQAQVVGGAYGYIAASGYLLGMELGNVPAGQCIDTSIFEACMCFSDVGAISMYNTGLQASRLGINRLPPTYPLGVFPCRDGWIGLTVLTPGQWHSFCELLGMQEFAHVPLFQSAAERGMAADVLQPVFSEKLLQFSAEELFYKAQHARIALARVPTMEELFQVDQYIERDAFCSVQLGEHSIAVPSVPFRLYAAPPRMGGTVAPLGAHTGLYA